MYQKPITLYKCTVIVVPGPLLLLEFLRATPAIGISQTESTSCWSCLTFTQYAFQKVLANTQPDSYIKWKVCQLTSVCFGRPKRDLLYPVWTLQSEYFHNIHDYNTLYYLVVVSLQFSYLSDQLLLSVTPKSSVSKWFHHCKLSHICECEPLTAK